MCLHFFLKQPKVNVDELDVSEDSYSSIREYGRKKVLMPSDSGRALPVQTFGRPCPSGKKEATPAVPRWLS